MTRYLMRSQSGRVWAVAPEASDGQETTLEHAQQIAEDLGFELLDAPVEEPVEDYDAHDRHVDQAMTSLDRLTHDQRSYLLGVLCARAPELMLGAVETTLERYKETRA